MKRNNIQNRFGWMPASLLLLFATACSESIIETANVGDKMPNVVTFTVNTESNTVSTRTGDGEDAAASNTYHISDGSHADVLKYAVYSVNTNGDFTLEEEFGKEDTIGIGTVTAGTGQVILSPTTYPHKIKLSLDPEKEYRVAFWAQSSKTNAYDTQDLQQVKVNYENAANNDELRDAFCAISNKITYLTESEEVILRRPLAQVNVGTTGWDYEGAAILDPSPVIYTQSKITLKGVAQYYDVVAGKALVDNGENDEKGPYPTTNATFIYKRIPAFINVSDDDFENLTYSPFDNEEYLKVKLYEGEGYKPYVSWKDYQDYKTKLAENEKKETPENLPELPETEQFKYLSMCYVLVPEAESLKNEDGTSKYPDATFGSVLSSVEFSAQGIEDNTSGSETAGIDKVFEIYNVPVQKNWRTNILGNNFFFVDQPLTLTIVTDYNGEYNYNDEKKEDGNTSDDPEEEVYGEIWFGNYGCTNQNASETNTFFKFLQHNYNQPVPYNSFHNHGNDYTTSIYNSKNVGNVLKMQGKTGISFDVKEPSTVTIVQAISRSSNTMPIADATLMFYKQKEGETLTISTSNEGITLLTASQELQTMNDEEFNGKAHTSKFTSTLLNPNNTTANYSATIYSAETIYGKTVEENTDTNKEVIIHTIYIEEPGTYIIRNGGQQFGAHATESGLAYIKVQKGGHLLNVDWDKWQKNEYQDDKNPEDKTESSDSADE